MGSLVSLTLRVPCSEAFHWPFAPEFQKAMAAPVPQLGWPCADALCSTLQFKMLAAGWEQKRWALWFGAWAAQLCCLVRTISPNPGWWDLIKQPHPQPIGRAQKHRLLSIIWLKKKGFPLSVNKVEFYWLKQHQAEGPLLETNWRGLIKFHGPRWTGLWPFSLNFSTRFWALISPSRRMLERPETGKDPDKDHLTK